MVVATAVLTGALMVGDSVRLSLRALAVQRLGPIDHAMVASRFFEESLALRIGASPDFAKSFEQIHAGILVRGGASTEDRKERTAGVQIGALTGNWIAVAKNSCVINSELASSLPSIKPGEKVIYAIPKLEDGPRDATLARRGRGDVISDITVQPQVSRVTKATEFEGMFNLSGGQRAPRNAWLNLADLQEAVGQSGRANLLLVHAKSTGESPDQASELQRIAHRVMTLGDYGLKMSPGGGQREAVLTTADTYLPRPIDEAADRAAKLTGVSVRRVSSYLINTVQNVGAKKEIHYAMIAGLNSLDQKPLQDDDVVLNQWAADQLAAKVGDEIRLEYYHREISGNLKEVASDRAGVGLLFHVVQILPMSGFGSDPTLTPAYKGLTDSGSISDWEAPAGLTIRKDWVTKADEAYWKRYNAAPKLFVSLNSAKKLWGGPFGDVTSLRVPAEKANEFSAELLKQIEPSMMGMSFRPIRAEQLAASSGSTDFGELFIYFSFFLIVAAVLLVAMLFRLNIEQRARQLGLLAAIGYTPKALRSMALKEGMIIAVMGSLIGLGGAVGYTALMMAGLRTWWFGAVGTSAMHLHVLPITLIYGFSASLIMAAIAILWGVWRVGRTSAGTLLAGGWATPTLGMKTRGKWGMRIGWLLLVFSGAMLASGLLKLISAQEAFLGGGTLLLIAAMILTAGRLRPKHGAAIIASFSSLGFRNASRHTARSVLTMGLIAFATFALVTVAALRGKAQEDTGDKKSGSGGYRLMARADIPLLGDLNTSAGRDVLAVSNPNDPLWSRLRFTQMRRWAGEDISCLNLTRPGSPTILSVPPGMVERNAFSFARSVKKVPNSWNVLEDPELSKEGIPVIADDETAEYILHLGLGQSISVTDQSGVNRKLILVATLSGSVFQGELLMAESNFTKLFPSQSGSGVVMIDVEPNDMVSASSMLASELGDFSVTVDRTADVLAMYSNVQNAYLSTFQVLGSLGLLLGTVGLAVVLLRGLIERKAEFAMLAAIGFRRVDRLRIVLAENALLLLLGLGIGTVCAIIAMLPELLQAGRKIHLIQLLLTLLGVLAAGMVSLIAAIWFGGKNITAADLRSE